VTAAHEPGAVVTGGSRIALAFARSLGRRAIPVTVLRSDEHVQAVLSRYTRRRVRWIDQGASRQLERLLELADDARLRGAMLIPTDDEQAALLARHHAQLSDCYRMTVPPWDILRHAYDKRRMHELATGLGMEQPRTWAPATAREVEQLDCPFPVIVKPSVKRESNALTDAKAWKADDRPALVAKYRAACSLVDPSTILIQEFIPGTGAQQLSFAALCADGEVRASLTARRQRQFPVDFGRHSTFVVTIEDASVEEAARALLAAMRWRGLVEVEFKRDPRTGSLKLLDVNARGWSWLSLGARAGVDFPYLLWRLTLGHAVAPVRARPGVGWVRPATDVPAAVEEMRRGVLSPRGYVRSLCRPLELAIFAADDPVPAVASPFLEGYPLATTLLRRMVRRRPDS
jgi:D-aspartate ligase